LCYYEDYHVYDAGADSTQHSYNEEQKESIVTFADAVIYEGTVMIKHLYAVVAGRTVACPRRAIYVASGTMITILFYIIFQ